MNDIGNNFQNELRRNTFDIMIIRNIRSLYFNLDGGGVLCVVQQNQLFKFYCHLLPVVYLKIQ